MFNLQCSIVLHHPIHLTSVFFFFQRLTLVKLLLTLAERNVHLRTAFFVDEYQQRNDGLTRLLRGTGQTADFLLGQQEFPVTFHLMVIIRAIEIRTDTHALHPQFTVDDGAISIHQTGLTQTDALDLRTRQDDTRRVGLYEEVLKRGLLVFDLYRTFLPELFLFLVHLYSSIVAKRSR